MYQELSSALLLWKGKSRNLFPMNQSPGLVIRTLREKTGLTAREVAERARISESYLSRVESGKVIPTDAWLGAVASMLSDALVEKAARTTATPDTATPAQAVA